MKGDFGLNTSKYLGIGKRQLNCQVRKEVKGYPLLRLSIMGSRIRVPGTPMHDTCSTKSPWTPTCPILNVVRKINKGRHPTRLL